MLRDHRLELQQLPATRRVTCWCALLQSSAHLSQWHLTHDEAVGNSLSNEENHPKYILTCLLWLINRFKLNGLNAIVILRCGCFPMLPGRACPSPKHPHLRRPSLWPVRCQPNRPNTISPGWPLRHPCHLNVDVLWEVTRDKNKENGNIFGNWWALSLCLDHPTGTRLGYGAKWFKCDSLKHVELEIYSRQAAKSLPKNDRCTIQSQCEPSTRLAPQSSSAFQHKYGNALPQRHIEYEHRMGSAGTRIPPHPPMWSPKKWCMFISPRSTIYNLIFSQWSKDFWICLRLYNTFR